MSSAARRSMMGLSRQNQKAFASRVLALTTAPRSLGGESSGCDIFFYRPAASVSALPQWSTPARPRFAGHGEYPYRLALDGLDRDRQITALAGYAAVAATRCPAYTSRNAARTARDVINRQFWRIKSQAFRSALGC